MRKSFLSPYSEHLAPLVILVSDWKNPLLRTHLMVQPWPGSSSPEGAQLQSLAAEGLAAGLALWRRLGTNLDKEYALRLPNSWAVGVPPRLIKVETNMAYEIYEHNSKHFSFNFTLTSKDMV